LAELMVTTYGMSQVLGPLAYRKIGKANFLGPEGNMRRNISEKTAEAIDREVKEIVENAHQLALDILEKNRDLLDEIASHLLAKEVVEGDELQTQLDRVQPLD
ncbi:MAG: cell division protein FtsH, partial [Cyanobacteriota bacterium]|nr:cell division protein FtsH [Cyanobacteriota bacterium]